MTPPGLRERCAGMEAVVERVCMNELFFFSSFQTCLTIQFHCMYQIEK